MDRDRRAESDLRRDERHPWVQLRVLGDDDLGAGVHGHERDVAADVAHLEPIVRR